MREIKTQSMPGGIMLAGAFVLLGGAGVLVKFAADAGQAHDVGTAAGFGVGAGVIVLAAILTLAGLYVVNPNEGRVLQLFGKYVGTVRDEGLRWASPFYSKRAVSLRARNFETAKIKVNDLGGNPIEIGAIVTWRVVDTAQAVFEVQDYGSFVTVQAEAALRNLATHHPYDGHDEAAMSLRGHTDAIAGQLEKEIQDRIGKAGVEVTEARIAHLAYAPEIAQAMLQRQQAGAIIAARSMIVDGAVGMVEMALKRLADNNIVELDAERKAAMVSNLLVVLCGERGAQPVLNAGTLYST
jgi:regulator of protease activity HflC (stomatin/prohibitin superfamily)